MLKRAPGSSREYFSAVVVSLSEKKLLRKVWRVIGWLQGVTTLVTGSIQPCPLPPQMTVRWKLKSKFFVGLKAKISECTHGSFGSWWPCSEPIMKS